MSAAQPEVQVSLTQKDMRAFPRRVRDLVLTLVNEYHIRFRMQDGGHMLLYGPNPETGAQKVSASRGEEQSVKWLTKWANENVPNYEQQAVPPKTVARKRAASEMGTKLVAEAAKKAAAARAEATAQPERNWLVSAKGRVYKYLYFEGETDKSPIRCAFINEDGSQCDYVTDNRRGVHLHEGMHTGLSQVITAKGIEKAKATRAAKRAQAQAKAEELASGGTVEVSSPEEAKAVLDEIAPAGPTPAEVHAAAALTKAEEGIKRQEVREAIELVAGMLGVEFTSSVEVQALKSEIARLKAENDDLHARLELVKETLGL